MINLFIIKVGGFFLIIYKYQGLVIRDFNKLKIDRYIH